MFRFLLATLIGFALMADSATAQLFSKSLNRNNIPNSAFASGTLFPKQLATDPEFDLFPREIVTAWGKAELGFDPMMLDQITFFMKTPGNLQAPPTWGAVLEFSEMQGLSGKLVNELQQKSMGGKTLFSGADRGLPSFLVVDEATLFAGDESLFAEMLAGDKSGQLASLMQGAKVKGQAIAIADIEPVRPVLNQLMTNIPAMLPPAITKLKLLPDMLQGLELAIVAKGTLNLELTLHFNDADQAEQGQKILKNAISLGKDLAIGAAAAQFDSDDPVQAATLEYIQRMADDYQGRISPELDRHRLVIKLEDDAALAPLLVGLLLPAAQSARASARRVSSMNNMRQMALAAHNYAAATGKFPAQASYDKNGKPLLSWRVHILPYIEQQALYDQFHLDEPWDSPHNRRLIKQMPMVYQSPSVAPEGGKTVYLGIAGENSVFGSADRAFAEITDGLSNTVMAVEVAPSSAVEWTRPVDYEFNRNRPMDGLGGINPGVFLATFADGSVRALSDSISPETWKALTTINGGEVSNDR